MKRFVCLLSVIVLLPFASFSQRVEVTQDENGDSYFTVFAYGLPRSIVKTNQEMADSKNERGMMRRHHNTKGFENSIGSDGYADGNTKISFGFYVASKNVDVNGNPTNSTEGMSWYEAAGWDLSVHNDVAAYKIPGDITSAGVGTSVLPAKPTGCAAYKGRSDSDTPGEWRLPTQREMQVMNTVIEQAMDENVGTGDDQIATIVMGDFWTATEYMASATWQTFVINNKTGECAPTTARDPYWPKHLVRCVKDVIDPINGAVK